MQVCYRSCQARVWEGVRHWHLWTTSTKVRRREFGADSWASNMLLLLSLLLKNSHDSSKLEKKQNGNSIWQQQYNSNSYCWHVHNCRGLNPNPHFIFTLQEQMTTNSILLFVLLCCLTSNYSIISCGTSTQILSLFICKQEGCLAVCLFQKKLLE